MNHSMSRRALLGGSVAATTAAIVGCSTPGAPSPAEATPPPAAILPTYRAVEVAAPDLPATDVVMPGYFSYPRPVKKVIAEAPGAGSDGISITYPTFQPARTDLATNSFFTQLQEDLGTTLTLTPIPFAEYTAKFQTMVAGGDLPDVVGFPLRTPQKPRVLKEVFADLGPRLSGDAVLDYPYLANIPSYSWLPAASNGSIYALPQHRAITGATLFFRPDILAQAGADGNPTSYAELVDIMRAVTDDKAERWAFSNPSALHSIVLGMMGGPNRWTVDGGRFASAYADERFLDAMVAVTDLVKEGLAHPNAAAATGQQHRDYFLAGSTAFTVDGYAAWNLFVGALESAEKLGMMVAPAFDGGGDGPHLAGIGYQAIMVVNQGVSDAKLTTILKVMDFLATPIGSAGNLRRKFGVEGVDFTWQGEQPTLTDHGKSNALDLQYIMDAPTILGPGPKDEVTTQHEWHQRTAANLIRDPSNGLYSETENSKGPVLARALQDVINGVYVGRSTVDQFKEAVATWRKSGGDQMAAEYAQAAETAG